MKRKLLRFLLSVQMIWMLPTGSVHAGEQTLDVGDYPENCCYIEYSGAATTEGAKMAGLARIDGAYKDVGNLAYLHLYAARFANGLYGLVMTKEDYQAMLQVHASCEAFLAGNMPSIVPQGTTWKKALSLCAAWIADHTVYDHAAEGDDARMRKLQSAVSCFYSGTGVCATYSTAFDSMVHFLPLNPETLCVDYTSKDPVHLDTRYVSNGTHEWSAVLEPDGWHFYDITFYDGDGSTRREEYLDMSPEACLDGFHDGIETWFPEGAVFAFGS